MAITEFSFLQLLLVQSAGERLAGDFFAFLGQANPHEAEGPSRLLLGRADAEQQLIAGRTLPAQVAQLPKQAHQLAAADGVFFGPSTFAPGEDV